MAPNPDDLSVRDSDPLWRRIHPNHYVPDGKGGMRLSSAAFDNSGDGTGMSVTLGHEAEEAGITPRLALAHYSNFGLASLLASACRGQHQTIERDATREDPYHALVNGKKTGSVKSALSRAASLLIAPGKLTG